METNTMIKPYFYNRSWQRGIVCILAIVGSINAQSQLALTFPFGLPVERNCGASFMMGGASNAVSGDYGVMLHNPANLGFIERTVFSSLYSFDFTQAAQSGEHTNFASGTPVQISIGIPAGKFGTLGLSCNMSSNALMKFRYPSQAFTVENSTFSYQPGLIATGGMVNWQLGWGREIPKLYHLRIGAVYERFYFSTSRTVLRTIADLTRTDYSRDSTYQLIRGNSLRGGLMLPIGKLKLGLSGEYFFPAKLQGDNAVYSSSWDTAGRPVSIDRRDNSGTVRVPPSFTLGAAYAITPEWLAAADFTSVLWDLYYSHDMLVKARTGSAQSFSIGAQYIPVISLLTPKYWETIRFGAGLRFTELPAKESSELALSLGAGLPIGNGRGEFDMAVEAGKRTVGAYSGYRENFIHFVIGINGGRKWMKSTVGNY